MSRPANWPADKPWPPQRVTPPLFPTDGQINVTGHLVHDAELRVGAGGSRGVLVFTVDTGHGHPYEVIRPVPAGADDLQAATQLQRALRRGIPVRVSAQGCLPRNDHGHAVLQLLEVTDITAI
jgi:hypothetical protein